MSCLLGVVLMSATWGPPPAAVAKALDSAPGFCLLAHGYVAGLTATRFGLQPFYL